MNENIKKNLIYNYLSRYNFVSEKDYKKLEKLLKKKEYFIYKEIFELLESCRIVESTLDRIIIEIDAEQNNHLLDDIAKKNFITRLSQRTAEKSWTRLCYGESIRYVKNSLFLK